jgi:hypothetical protein
VLRDHDHRLATGAVLSVSKTQRRADLAIDLFVDRVNRSAREPLPVDEVSEFLRDGPPLSDGWEVSWAIRRPLSLCAWIDAFEARLPGRLPRSYRSLVTRYVFPSFEVGRVRLFANTRAELPEGLELIEAVFYDPHLCTPLLAAGLVQFGRATGSYDPVCFDLRKRANSGECPIVHVDHEEALIHDRIEVVAELAPSFLALVGA